MHLGIDFGTTFSSAALLVNGEIKRVKEPLKLGYSFPSSVFVDQQGKVFVGQAAENQRLKDPSSYRREFKRELGTTVASSLGGRQFLPEELVTEVLKVLKTEAEKMVNQSIDGVIATVPASYMGYRYEIMEQAARNAGFTEVQLLAEPIAAAIYYDNPSSGGQVLADGEVLLVYDLGGGTFDAALLQKRGDRFELLAQPVGDENLGGSDFDRVIYKDLQRSCSDEVRSLLDPSQREVRALRAKLKVADWVRDFKHQLSVVEQHTEDLPVGDYEEYSLSRWGFQELIHQRVQTTCQLCDQLVKDAGLQWEQVGRILLVGGSCRIPYVGQMLEGRFGRFPTGDATRTVVWVDEPELAVCLGAAIYQNLTEQQHVSQENERQSLEEMLREEQQRRFDAEESARLLQEELAQVQGGGEKEYINSSEHKSESKEIESIESKKKDEAKALYYLNQGNFKLEKMKVHHRKEYYRAIRANRDSMAVEVDAPFLPIDKSYALEVLEDYNRAIDLSPHLAEAYNNRGKLKEEALENSQGACEDYEQAIALNPNFAEAYNNLGRIRESKAKMSLADYDQAILLNPSLATAYFNRGFLKQNKLNDPHGALSDYNQAISLDPQYAVAYNNRGVIKQQILNDLKGALADYKKACSIRHLFAAEVNIQEIPRRGILGFFK